MRNWLCIALVCASANAVSGVLTFDNRSDLAAAGTIVETNNFDDFGAGYGYPGDPFSRGSVTYSSARNLTVGAGTAYTIGRARTVLSNDFWSPLTGAIDGQFDLFGFDGAVTSGPVAVTLQTNVGSYQFSNLTWANGDPAFTFMGFRTTTEGEYFTQFRIDTLGSGYLPGITDVSLGQQVGGGVEVPEPSTLILMALGMAGLASTKRRL